MNILENFEKSPVFVPTHQLQNLFIYLVKLLLVAVLLELLHQPRQLPLLLHRQETALLDLLRLQTQQLLLLYPHPQTLLQNPLSLLPYEELRQLDRVKDRVPFPF